MQFITIKKSVKVRSLDNHCPQVYFETSDTSHGDTLGMRKQESVSLKVWAVIS
jgi:hypothetical protein